jgi:hypothetical protein
MLPELSRSLQNVVKTPNDLPLFAKKLYCAIIFYKILKMSEFHCIY